MIAAAIRKPGKPRAAAPIPDPSVDLMWAAAEDFPRPLRVLIAEDDAEMRSLLASSLRDSGYEVVEVGSGTELCRELAPQLIHPDAGRFHVIVSDVRMPGSTGLEVLEGLSALAELPPMILVTAFGDPEIHRQVRRLGAVILDKPFEIDDLLREVARACSRSLRPTPTGNRNQDTDKG